MTEHPGISVVVCTHNGTSRLQPTLQALFGQVTEPSLAWEILVIDNASTDNTAAFCEQLAVGAGLPASQFRVLHEPRAGLNYARHLGLVSAQYSFILFCDDDNHLFSHYVQTGATLIAANPNMGVLGGCGIPLFESAVPDWFQRYAHSFAVGSQAPVSGRVQSPVAEVYGAGAFVRRQPLLQFFERGLETITTDRKGNSLASGGDVEWCYIAQLAGWEVWYDERLQFYHTMPAARLQWPYYLRLKQGIASGAALLFPYHALLQQGRMPLQAFKRHYQREMVRRQLVWAKQAVRRWLTFRNTSPTEDLAYTIVAAKAASFRKHYKRAVAHYARLLHIS